MESRISGPVVPCGRRTRHRLQNASAVCLIESDRARSIVVSIETHRIKEIWNRTVERVGFKETLRSSSLHFEYPRAYCSGNNFRQCKIALAPQLSQLEITASFQVKLRVKVYNNPCRLIVGQISLVKPIGKESHAADHLHLSTLNRIPRFRSVLNLDRHPCRVAQYFGAR